MTLNDPRRLQDLTSFEKVLDYLRDELGWPLEVDELDAATFEYTPDELSINPKYAARIKTIKQLRPLVDQQVWGIFFVEFDNNRLPVMALRRILGSLVETRRGRDGSIPAWQRDDLLFICVYTSAAEDKRGQRAVTFAHFRAGDGAQPELRTFSWDSRETHFYYLRNLNLSALKWTANTRDADAWREQWRGAFTVRHRYTIRTSERLASQMAKQAIVIRELVDDLYDAEGENGALHKLYTRLKIDLIHDLDGKDFADMIAQTITYGVFSAAVQNNDFTLDNLSDAIPDTNLFLKRMLETLTRDGGLDLDELGVGQLVDLLRQIDLPAITRDFGRQTGGGSEDPVIHFYEQFLNEYDRQQRVQRGVFYTPDPVVEYIVKAVDQILQRPVEQGGFGIADGLASDATAASGEPLVQILDPATGTGTFLAHIIDHIAAKKNPRAAQSETWNRYVAGSLLKRLNGFELMMAPYTIAHLKLGLKLRQTGYTFGTGERLRVFLTNALEKPVAMSEVLLETDYLSREANEANLVKRSKPIMVVIGNPPYSGHSANQIPEDWFKLNDYYFVDGQPLGERNPKWLQDDYVKFIRFGQWRIEQTGEGILAFISNHGYLDNPTFRGMRQQLMNTFDLIYILDLHGNARKKESNPSGGKDENVFDIQQGVAIAIFVRHKEKNPETKVFHRHIWGIRETKYEWLLKGENLDVRENWSELHPHSPFYLFVPEDRAISAEYIQGWRISELLPIYAAGMVTARDSLTIQFSEGEIQHVVQDFASLPSEMARQKYSLGQDVRDWKVSLAQNDLNSHQVRKDLVAPVHYRPFDFRFTYYTGQSRGFICMPRPEVMGHMLAGNNLGLISARSNKSDTMNHFFASRFITEAKTGEATTQSTLFPLYLYPNNAELFDTSEWSLSEKGRRPNLSKAFVEQFGAKLGLEFVTDGRGDLHRTFGPEDVFHYAYAIFHSPTYRTRYAEQLKIDFPRLPLTNDVELFRQLVMRGVDLVALHLLEDDYAGAYWNRHGEPSPLSEPRLITRFVVGKNGSTVGAMSKNRAYDANWKRIYIDTSELIEGSYFEFNADISAEDARETWDFQIGGYQVLHKWLYDRRPQGAEAGRTLTDEDITHYQRVVVALHLTRQLMDDIDEVINEHGGFPLAGSSPEDADVQPILPTDEEVLDSPVDEHIIVSLSAEESDDMPDSNQFFDQRRLLYAEGEQVTLDDGRNSDPLTIQLPQSKDISEADEAFNLIEGVESEPEDGGSDRDYPISQPFDPRDIKIATERFSLDVLINRLREDEIDLSPAFQRAGGIWKDGNQSRLIESILIRLPLPAFYFDASDDDKWQVIDGLQRLTAIKRFVIEKSLRLTDMEFLKELNRKLYDDLDKRLMRDIREAQVTAYMIQPGTPTQLKFNIFKRINTGGVPLSAQEIRNALYQHKGPAIDTMKRLAKSDAFKRATNFSVSPMRMADQELVLRFIAFARVSFTEYGRSEDLDNFVNTCLEKINGDDKQIPALERRFFRAMDVATKVFDKKAFRKQFKGGRVGPVSKALFEAWGINLEALTVEQVALLVERRESLIDKFQELLADPDFDRAISYSTGNYTAVQLRFGAIGRIIREVLNG